MIVIWALSGRLDLKIEGESVAKIFDHQVEVHQAQRPGLHTRVYFLLYRCSIIAILFTNL